MRPTLPTLLIPSLLGACVPHLACDEAVGDARPLACGGTWIAPDNDWSMAVPPADLEGEGMAEGQRVYDVRGTDQRGQEVSLWQFWGQHVLLDISTMWCRPCQQLAIGTEAVYQEFRDQGFVYLTILHENEQNAPPSREELELWADFPSAHPDPAHPYDLITAPIIADPGGRSGSIEAVRNNQYPVALLVGPDMRVLERIEPVTDEAIREAVAAALAD